LGFIFEICRHVDLLEQRMLAEAEAAPTTVGE
jgi:hypothetical protein